MTKTISLYIEFAEKNKFTIPFENDWGDTWEINDGELDLLDGDGQGYKSINIIELITSKDYIETIARGKIKPLIEKGIIKKEETLKDRIISEITIAQAIAIRDGELNSFITNLLPNDL